jgi:hypothetical protein
MKGDDQSERKTQDRQWWIEGSIRRLKPTKPVALIIAALFLLIGAASQTNTAAAQYVTLGEKIPPTSGCYKPELYDHGVNMDIKVWSASLTAGDLRQLGAPPPEGLESAFEGMSQVQAGRLARVVAKDLSRLRDTGTVVANELPKGADGQTPVHFYVQINLETVKSKSGEVTGYVAAVHLEELCSVWGEGKDIGMGVREVEVPGILILSNLADMVRNVEDLVYDKVIDFVSARRQSVGDANSKSKQAPPEKKP